jgi:hypothetical protein
MRHSDIVKTGSRTRNFEASSGSHSRAKPAHSARAIPRVASSSGATVIGIPQVGDKDSPDARWLVNSHQLEATPNAMDPSAAVRKAMTYAETRSATKKGASSSAPSRGTSRGIVPR